jgi:hypothetical protein
MLGGLNLRGALVSADAISNEQSTATRSCARSTVHPVSSVTRPSCVSHQRI